MAESSTRTFFLEREKTSTLVASVFGATTSSYNPTTCLLAQNLNKEFSLKSPIASTSASRKRKSSNEDPQLPEKRIDIDDKLAYCIMEMFPDICRNYLRSICKGKKITQLNVDMLSGVLCESDYPKRIPQESEPEEKFNYQQQQNPTMGECLGKQKQYTSEFNVEKFLEVIPNPANHFKYRHYRNLDRDAHSYAICFLRNRYRSIMLRTIRQTLLESESLREVCNKLEKTGPLQKLKKDRALCLMPAKPQDILLLQEEIIEYIEKKRAHQEELSKVATTCQCCFEEDVKMSNMFYCEAGCQFCRDCVKKSAEVTYGDGKLNFMCLGDCDSEFGLQTLQNVLPITLFSQIESAKQIHEIKSACIEDLAMCPFCNFAVIMAKEDKIFQCLNPDCMKETCRLCKEASHIPLRCEEVEKDSDVKKRTYIEDKMTEALLRKCWKCGMKFIKSEGCNKMTCSCGAKMCYICNQPVMDYTHFNGPGGDNHHLCPLYSDMVTLHESEVLKGADAAKREISKTSGTMTLKSDPATDAKKHYKKLRKQQGR